MQRKERYDDSLAARYQEKDTDKTLEEPKKHHEGAETHKWNGLLKEAFHERTRRTHVDDLEDAEPEENDEDAETRYRHRYTSEEMNEGRVDVPDHASILPHLYFKFSAKNEVVSIHACCVCSGA